MTPAYIIFQVEVIIVQCIFLYSVDVTLSYPAFVGEYNNDLDTGGIGLDLWGIHNLLWITT